MKIYTEVNYEWRDDQLVQTSSESFDYEGEVQQCGMFGGGGGWNPIKKLTETVVYVVQDNPINVPDVDLNPLTSNINVPTIKPPDISNVTQGVGDFMSNFQVDTAGANSMITGALNKVNEGGAYVGHYAQRLKRRMEQGLTEIGTGKGDYADDQEKGEAPPPTGSEQARAMSLVSTPKYEQKKGRGYHSVGGSASMLTSPTQVS